VTLLERMVGGGAGEVDEAGQGTGATLRSPSVCWGKEGATKDFRVTDLYFRRSFCFLVWRLAG
jgi:hypothetical protein